MGTQRVSGTALTSTALLFTHACLPVPQWPAISSQAVSWADFIARLAVHRRDVTRALLVRGKGKMVALIEQRNELLQAPCRRDFSALMRTCSRQAEPHRT